MKTEQTRLRHERREAERLAARAVAKPRRTQVEAAERRSRRIRGAACRRATSMPSTSQPSSVMATGTGIACAARIASIEFG